MTFIRTASNDYDSNLRASRQQQSHQEVIKFFTRNFDTISRMTDESVEMPMTRGSAIDAEGWIGASALSEDEKSSLLEFVAKFPQQTFTKENDDCFRLLERRHRIVLPAWVREIRSALAFIDPPAQFRLDLYEAWTPREDREEPIWYTPEWGYSDGQERTALLKADLFPIGVWIETAHSYLGINIRNSNDKRIFEFAAEDVIDDTRNGLPPDSSVFPVFDSYPAMMRHIVELQLDDGTVIPAR